MFLIHTIICIAFALAVFRTGSFLVEVHHFYKYSCAIFDTTDREAAQHAFVDTIIDSTFLLSAAAPDGCRGISYDSCQQRLEDGELSISNWQNLVVPIIIQSSDHLNLHRDSGRYAQVCLIIPLVGESSPSKVSHSMIYRSGTSGSSILTLLPLTGQERVDAAGHTAACRQRLAEDLKISNEALIGGAHRRDSPSVATDLHLVFAYDGAHRTLFEDNPSLQYEVTAATTATTAVAAATPPPQLRDVRRTMMNFINVRLVQASKALRNCPCAANIRSLTVRSELHLGLQNAILMSNNTRVLPADAVLSYAHQRRSLYRQPASRTLQMDTQNHDDDNSNHHQQRSLIAVVYIDDYALIGNKTISADYAADRTQSLPLRLLRSSDGRLAISMRIADAALGAGCFTILNWPVDADADIPRLRKKAAYDAAHEVVNCVRAYVGVTAAESIPLHSMLQVFENSSTSTASSAAAATPAGGASLLRMAEEMQWLSRQMQCTIDTLEEARSMMSQLLRLKISDWGSDSLHSIIDMVLFYSQPQHRIEQFRKLQLLLDRLRKHLHQDDGDGDEHAGAYPAAVNTANTASDEKEAGEGASGADTCGANSRSDGCCTNELVCLVGEVHRVVLAVYHDPHGYAQEWWSWEQLFAVLGPFWIPLMVPIYRALRASAA